MVIFTDTRNGENSQEDGEEIIQMEFNDDGQETYVGDSEIDDTENGHATVYVNENSFEWILSDTSAFPLPRDSKVNFNALEQARIDFDENREISTNNPEAVDVVENNHEIQANNAQSSNAKTNNTSNSHTMDIVEMKDDTVQFFSPPSTSNSCAIPSHFKNLDPELHTLLTKAAQDKTDVRKSQTLPENNLEIVKKIFPGECAYVRL